MKTRKTLKQIIQEFNDIPVIKAGGKLAANAQDPLQFIHAQLRSAQAQNDLYFKSYWISLMIVFALTVGMALIYRQEMGGLPVVLGAGGVMQGGLVVLLGKTLKEKTRVGIVAVLAVGLPATELQAVLKDLLAQL